MGIPYLIIRQERLFGREQQRSSRVHPRSNEEPEQPSDIEEVRCAADVDFRVNGVDETREERRYCYEYSQCCPPVLQKAEAWCV